MFVLTGTAFLQFKNQSSVQPCLDASANEGLCYHGNRLATSMAVTKEEAKGLKGQRSGGKEDKRNLYLAKEGCECFVVIVMSWLHYWCQHSSFEAFTFEK